MDIYEEVRVDRQKEKKETDKNIHSVERTALTNNPNNIYATQWIVSALSRYRQACELLLSQRFKDGACDGSSMGTFEYTISEIDEDVSHAWEDTFQY